MSAVIPSRRLIALVALVALPLAAGVFVPGLTSIGLGIDVLLLGMVLLDWRRSPAPGVLELAREAGPLLSIGAENPVRITARNRSAMRLRALVRESMPGSFLPIRKTLELEIGPYGETVLEFRVKPTRRGEYHFGPLTLRLRSSLGLLWRQVSIDAGGPVRVYPDVDAIRQFDLAARQERMAELGLRRVRWIGGGTEFESLRDYGPDDGLRMVDWKATARRGRAIARQHQLERSQPIMLMIDAGRLMSREFGGLSRLDHAINAALLLAHIARARGDRVGLLTFGEKVQRFIPPVSGSAMLPSLVAGLYDLQPGLRESDVAAAFGVLATRHRKRSLVVVFTEVSSIDASELLIGYLAGLSPRHVPLVVCIRDTDLQRRAQIEAGRERDVLEKAAAVTLLEERQEALEALEQRGAMVVDVAPDELNLAVVNRYLELKARGRL